MELVLHTLVFGLAGAASICAVAWFFGVFDPPKPPKDVPAE